MERLRDQLFTALLHVLFFVGMYACSDDVPELAQSSTQSTPASPYQTEHVIVVVIDGPRFSDTWAKPLQPHIPFMANTLQPQGVFFRNFYNRGATYTLAGHTAITTGHYQTISNDGSEIPQEPSFLQQYLQQTGLAPDKACLVTSKAKLAALADSRNMDWRGRFNPYFDCGEGAENRSDVKTLAAGLQVLEDKQPTLMVMQFLGPDAQGHANNWPGYLNALEETDSLVHELWTWVQEQEHYRNKTTLLITNDHGRHADGHKEGFVSHGDDCKSCQHISLLALGPDFRAGTVVEEEYEQADLAPTIAQLLGFELQSADGAPIQTLLTK